MKFLSSSLISSFVRWNDFNVTSMEQITSYGPPDSVSISSYIPLWAGLLSANDSNTALQQSVLSSLESSNLIQEAGVLTTTIPSGQQWDSPNAWPPLVLLTIEGLRRMTIPEAHTLAVRLNSCYFIDLSPLGYNLCKLVRDRIPCLFFLGLHV